MRIILGEFDAIDGRSLISLLLSLRFSEITEFIAFEVVGCYKYVIKSLVGGYGVQAMGMNFVNIVKCHL